MVVCGRIWLWPNMAVYGCIWVHLAVDGRMSANDHIYGCIWLYMVSCDRMGRKRHYLAGGPLGGDSSLFAAVAKNNSCNLKQQKQSQKLGSPVSGQRIQANPSVLTASHPAHPNLALSVPSQLRFARVLQCFSKSARLDLH